MLALESKEMMDARKPEEGKVSTTVKSTFDSILSDMAKSGIKLVKKPEGKAKSSKTKPFRKAATPPPLMPEPENPKLVCSKPDPKEDPLTPTEIFGKNPVKTIVNKIVEAFTGGKEEPVVVKRTKKGDHIYV
jgi:hypothetical protein